MLLQNSVTIYKKISCILLGLLYTYAIVLNVYTQKLRL